LEWKFGRVIPPDSTGMTGFRQESQGHHKDLIVGIKNFVVEVDAKYIKGMINNPDIQPSATINRWIAGILLFDFKLRHVPAKDHIAADH
jgi:hypothetical protein